MRKYRRLIFLVGIVLSLGGVGYKLAQNIWLTAAREIKKNPLKALDYAPEAALRIKDFHRSKIEDGRKIWELYGDEAHYLKEEKEAIIQKPRFFFYDKKGDTVEAEGDRGRLFFTEKELDRIEFQGDVRMTHQGFVLRSEEALYFPDQDQILLPGKVTVVGDGLEVEGVRMEVAVKGQKMRLLHNVKTKLQPEKLEKRNTKIGTKKASDG